MAVIRLSAVLGNIFLLALVLLTGWGGVVNLPASAVTVPAADLLLAAASGGAGEKMASTVVPPLAADPRTAGMEAYEKNELEQAARLLREAAALDPNDLEVSRRLGFALKETGRYEEALEVLERVVAASPDDYYHWWWLSDVQRLLGRYVESLQSMERSQRLATSDLRGELQEYVDYTARLAAPERTWENVAVHVDFAARHRSNRRVRRQIAELIQAYSLCPEVAPDDREALGRKAHICQQLGIQHLYIEEPEVAVDWFSKSAHLSEAGGYAGDQMQALKEWAGALWAMARQHPEQATSLLAQAADHYTAALSLALSIRDVAQERQTRALLLRVRGRLCPPSDPDLAALRDRNLKEVPWKGPVNEFSTAEAVAVEAELRVREGDYAGARILLEMAMPYYRESPYLSDYHRLTELQLLLSYVWLRMEQPAAALDCVETARKKAQEAQNYIDFDAFNRGQGALFQRYLACARIRAMIADGPPGDHILNVAEQALERDLFYRMRGLLSDDAPRRDIAGEALALRARLPWLETRLAEAQIQGDTAEAERLRRRVAQDRDRLAWIEGTGAEEQSLLRDYRPLPVLGGERFRNMLAPGVAVLHLLSDPHGTVAVLTTNAESITLESDLSDTEAAVLAVRIRQGGEDGKRGLTELQSRLAVPVLEWLRTHGTAALILCADSHIGRLPLNALFESAGMDSGPTYVSRLPYASQLDVPARETPLPRMLAAEAAVRSYPPIAELIEAWIERGGVVGATPDPEGLWVLAPVLYQLPSDPLLCRLSTDPDGAGGVTTARLLRYRPWKAGILLVAWRPADPDDTAIRSDWVSLLYEAARISGGSAMLLPDWQTNEETAAAFYTALAGFLDEYAFPESVARAREVVRRARPDDGGWLAFSCWGTDGIPRSAAGTRQVWDSSPKAEPTAEAEEAAGGSSIPDSDGPGNGMGGTAVTL